MVAVTALNSPDWTDADALPGIFQVLHKQAHPDGTEFWDNCREPGCAQAYDLLNGDE